jgi:hypothetical protein
MCPIARFAARTHAKAADGEDDNDDGVEEERAGPAADKPEGGWNGSGEGWVAVGRRFVKITEDRACMPANCNGHGICAQYRCQAYVDVCVAQLLTSACAGPRAAQHPPGGLDDGGRAALGLAVVKAPRDAGDEVGLKRDWGCDRWGRWGPWQESEAVL